uniref:Uncharacterized protein n=1 Tax=Anguilla anguilla TaxID=7936 RepID=A0A0E9Q1H8_ANGAN
MESCIFEKCSYFKIIFNCNILVGGTVVQWVALSPHSKKVVGSNLGLGPFCAEFACSPRVCVCFLRVLRFPPTVQRHAGRPIGDPKLPIGKSV